MDRLTIIQSLMAEKGLKNYLELGVFKGHVFFKVKGSLKVAVDPHFLFDKYKRFRKMFSNPANFNSRYYKKTSDDFFSENASSVFAKKHIHIALVDGMHEYGHVVRDVENTLKYLSDDGIIILHDCNPESPEWAVSFEEWKNRKFEGTWTGDVWKAIVHFRSFRNDLNVFVLDCDYGLGFITKGKPDNNLSFTKAQIDALTYDNFAANKENWLNLKTPSYINDFFKLKNKIQ